MRGLGLDYFNKEAVPGARELVICGNSDNIKGKIE